ncbi:MAG: LPS-assembly protein LptD [Vulcanimicrobiaceae bacterium]
MPLYGMNRRGLAAIVCLLAFLSGLLPAVAAPSKSAFESERALQLLNGQTCAQRERAQYVAQLNDIPTPSASPSASPSSSPTPLATPTFPPVGGGTTTLFATPRPRISPGSVTPPPIPTATPNPAAENAPVFLERGGDTPPPITPAGQVPPPPTPVPTGVPTLAPNYIAILADKVTGSTKQGQPGDAIGNVHIYYAQEEIVGEKAHFDGQRTVTITGHPYIIDHARDSVLQADTIIFDTIDQTAKLVNGNGTSSQGVDRGLVHFKAKDLHSDANGVSHGLAPYVTTCENPRGGYHITGRNMDVYPGDKIVIYKAILWLGAAAVFFLPKVVIPLRTIVDDREKPHYFPNIGYDQYEGFWIKTRLTFGKNQYYYGYYRVDYFTKVGLGVGYVGFYQKRNGRRSLSVDAYGIHDRRSSTSTYNINLQEIENFSRALRGNFGFSYNSNYGPYTNLPANESFNGTIVHQSARTSQNYTFSRSQVGTQSSSNSLAFTDNRQINQKLSQAVSFNLSNSQSSFNGFSSSNSTAHFNSLTHYSTSSDDYLLTIDKTFARQPYGINKLPELQIRPYKFLSHFIFPVNAQFTAGEYSEPSNGFSTQRLDMSFGLGPELLRVFGSDFQASGNIRQDAYGTGDLKAQIQQNMSLTTPLGKHFVNSITYNEANYNGPAFEPFQYLDQQPTTNQKNAQDLLRVFNGDTYNLSLGFSTNFNAIAQAVSYQFAARPSMRSILLLGGSFNPGPGQGFYTTNVQLAMPFGHDASLQLITDVDWKNKGRLENKVIYYTKTIGNCYQLQALYNQSQKLVTVSINILAFPNKGATFAVGQTGPIVPTTFNF